MLESYQHGRLSEPFWLSKFFCALVKPHLLFTLPVWSNASTGNITTMDCTILQAARIILRSRSATLGKKIAAGLDIIPFKFLTFKYNVLRIFNVLSSREIFHYLDCDLLSRTSTYNTHGTVNHKFNALKHNRTFDEFCFEYESVHNWNNLLNDLMLCTNYKQFYSKLNIHIVS